MKRKTVTKYVDWGLGFPIVLRNVPMIEVDGQWTPDINYKQLERCVLQALAYKTARLTGNEVRFIRHFFGMNLVAFAKRFAVSHPAVIAWERHGDASTDMNWSTEKDLRQELLLRLAPEGDQALGEKLLKLYRELRTIVESKDAPVEQDCRKLLPC